MKTPTNTFKQALAQGKQQYGFWLGLCNSIAAELCAHSGYDWLLIDAEHAPNDLRTVLSQLQAIEGTGTHAVVRLPDGNATSIKQYLDIGAQSLLIPMIETKDQALELVRAITYPPHGIRGVGTALARAARWNISDDYFEKSNDSICLIIQIESTTALSNLDDILTVEGIDGIFIGPADLAATMGHLGNPAHPAVKSAVEAAIKKINAAGKAAGTLAVVPTVARHYETVGVQFIALGLDTTSLVNSSRSILANHLQAKQEDDVGY